MNSRRNVSRKNRRGVFSYAYRPVGHLLSAADSTVGAITNTTRNVVRSGLRGVNRVGKSVTGHANAAVSGLLRFKRKDRKASRKSRKASRKSRRSTRRSRRH
jgi:hypothetical protein